MVLLALHELLAGDGRDRHPNLHNGVALPSFLHNKDPFCKGNETTKLKKN